ncbi:Uncharacterised protein [Burkholderia pseudomallei]|nr:Uncharacterised protein [Burkholderia pseudomallei]CAJ3587371.1 Uncharacterised protein [Burkholderia pseudomallei]CAJ5394028.1 Uncharacterised protein [Burkholderia pseudomallei]CAJ9034456.1 Uncharacterised protein [Burkholderia pseudomallei]CAJ9837501.1 Uncharacterised protein [Burkholderia pseudomallei]
MHVEAISARYQRSFEPRSARQDAVVDMNTTDRNSLSLTTRDGIQAVIPTDVAAAALNRKPQTLRKWACLENGPVRPVRINGRLAWRVADIQALLNGGAA